MQNRIRERIKESGIMQKDLAAKLEITPIGLSQIANTKMPKIETYEKIAEALGVPVWKLILSDEELAEIRSDVKAEENPSNQFQCPVCGSALKVGPCDEKQV